jgi:uncharacterized protein
MGMDSIDFSRPIPLFPLPNCVVFPGVVQPLHIFEPRYLEMIAETLSDQSVLAMALLKPGWEKDYYGFPEVYPLVCVGKVIAHEKMEDGKYNLLLHGVARANVVVEARRDLYRVARLEPCFDVAGSGTTPLMITQRKVLHDLLEQTALKDLTVTPTLKPLFSDAEISTARLLDLMAYTFVQDIPTKQRLLEELDPVRRGELVLRQMVTLAAQLGASGKGKSGPTWPPPLNAN